MTSTHKIFFPVIILFASLIITFGFSGCSDEYFSTNPKYKLEFSTDTLTFDTVFTTLGSATAKILVFNRNKVALKISHIGIAGGKSSSFKMNVDGSVSADNQFKDIEIRANDSLFIFMSVKVDPTKENSPVLIEDSLTFQTNGVNQNIKLQAFGQNMVLLKNKYVLSDTTLTATKPYLIYGHLTIDSAKTLTLEPGTKLYFHNNANLVVYGNLKAEGTAEKPIILRGDRLDKIKYVDPVPYNFISGQWGGIYLLWDGGNHVMKHVNMNSGYVGVYFFNNNRNKLPNLEISDCRIHNFLLYGLVVQNGNMTVTNTEISNTSSYSVYLNGGKHTFVQSTIANYYGNLQPNNRDNKPAVMIMNLNRVAPMETVFRNCVISGSYENEFSLASKFLTLYKGTFDHCYIRKTAASDLPQFTNIRWYQKNDTVFKSIHYDEIKGTYYNFMPDSVSPARGLADPVIAAQYPLDLNGNNRLEDGKPDAGAYEWEPTKK
jgi:hypothetical protein